MLEIAPGVVVEEHEIELAAIRAQGAGGQNVNKVSSAIHLRFDIAASALPEHYKTQLLTRGDSRITREGVVVIKAQNHRTQEKNRQEALDRLAELIRAAGVKPKPRRATKPTRNSQKRRVDKKVKHGQQKSLRQKVDF